MEDDYKGWFWFCQRFCTAHKDHGSKIRLSGSCYVGLCIAEVKGKTRVLAVGEEAKQMLALAKSMIATVVASNQLKLKEGEVMLNQASVALLNLKLGKKEGDTETQ